MRIFLIASSPPLQGHSIRAATVLVREALLALREQGHEVVLQLILGREHAPVSPDDLDAMAWARHQGFGDQPILREKSLRPPRRLGLVRDALTASIADLYPSVTLRDYVRRQVDRTHSDAVFNLWSTPGLAASSTAEAPVFTYYGNPDHKPLQARLRHSELFDISTRRLSDRVRLRLLMATNERRRQANAELMRMSHWLGCVTAVDVPYWQSEGHANAFYLQNMWPASHDSPVGQDWREDDDRIVGSLGGLYATGNTFGLAYLGREIVPALERRIGSRFRVHVYGAGQPTSAAAGAIGRSTIVRRGFVDDIDAEIRAAKVFLIANSNHPDFVGGHTRVLHAWSVGACVIGHERLGEAMPEIRHGENALLGHDADDIAAHVERTLRDSELRRRLAVAGRRTLQEYFTPQIVMRKVVEVIRAR